jgi:uncharacterized coiled-coil DUF342 family protein
MKDRMTTKYDVCDIVRDELKEYATKRPEEDRGRARRREAPTDPHESLSEINRRLDALEEHYSNLKSVTREVDEIRADVRAIEKHLGI